MYNKIWKKIMSNQLICNVEVQIMPIILTSNGLSSQAIIEELSNY